MATRPAYPHFHTAGVPPRTPYTPFTSFASKQNPFDLSFTAPSPSVHLLDDRDNALARLYNQILRFVERDMKRIMEIADKVSIKNVAPSRGDRVAALASLDTSAKTAEGQGFQIMANVVWAEVGKTVMEELGGVVFAAGNPNEFRQVRLSCLLCVCYHMLNVIYRTTRQPKPFSDRLKSWRLQHNPSRLCGCIPSTLPLSDVGNFLSTFN
jgi:hypothetical protein